MVLLNIVVGIILFVLGLSSFIFNNHLAKTFTKMFSTRRFNNKKSFVFSKFFVFFESQNVASLSPTISK